MTAPLRRCLTPVVAVLAAFAVLAGPTPASAAPHTAAPNPSGHAEDDDPPLISEAVTAANRAYLQAKSKLDKSRKRQLQLALEVKAAQNQLDALSPQVTEIGSQEMRSTTVVSEILR